MESKIERGKRLKEERLELKMTCEDMGLFLDCSRQTVSRIEQGKGTKMDFKFYEMIIDNLKNMHKNIKNGE